MGGGQDPCSVSRGLGSAWGGGAFCPDRVGLGGQCQLFAHSIL